MGRGGAPRVRANGGQVPVSGGGVKPAEPEIHAVRWWSIPCVPWHFGAVLLIDRTRGYWKAYIGVARGADPDVDARDIAECGAKLSEDEGRAFAGPEAWRLDGLEFRP